MTNSVLRAATSFLRTPKLPQPEETGPTILLLGRRRSVALLLLRGSTIRVLPLRRLLTVRCRCRRSGSVQSLRLGRRRSATVRALSGRGSAVLGRGSSSSVGVGSGEFRRETLAENDARLVTKGRRDRSWSMTEPRKGFGRTPGRRTQGLTIVV